MLDFTPTALRARFHAIALLASTRRLVLGGQRLGGPLPDLAPGRLPALQVGAGRAAGREGGGLALMHCTWHITSALHRAAFSRLLTRFAG